MHLRMLIFYHSPAGTDFLPLLTLNNAETTEIAETTDAFTNDSAANVNTTITNFSR